jgi:fructuronate reductase
MTVRTAPGSAVPYDRTALVPTVVHVGPGGFHRAHQAVYADALLRSGERTGAGWAVSMRSTGLRDALAPHGFVYPVVERSTGPDGTVRERTAVVGALLGVDCAAQDVERVLHRLAHPAVTVVTLTVSEHGYCAAGPGGPLDTGRDEVRHDLAAPHAPRSVPGLLLEALRRRRAAGLPPFAVASCDNLPGNGAAVRRVVTELAGHHDGRLAAWVAAEVAFPSSMVDRMVPATDGTGPVVTEPFSQWVVEDTFPAGRPAWERVGVELVTDARPYERAKLRVLNAAHSALAYWGLLRGHRLVSDAVADGVVLAAVRDLLAHEVLPVLDSPPGWDLDAYAAQVLLRFADPALPYETVKVATDGSQKLVARLVPTVTARLDAGLPSPRAAQVVAAWTVCLRGPLRGRPAVPDAALAAGPAAGPDEAVDALLALPGFPGGARPGGAAFALTVRRAARALWDGDPGAVLAAPPLPAPEVHAP